MSELGLKTDLFKKQSFGGEEGGSAVTLVPPSPGVGKLRLILSLASHEKIPTGLQSRPVSAQWVWAGCSHAAHTFPQAILDSAGLTIQSFSLVCSSLRNAAKPLPGHQLGPRVAERVTQPGMGLLTYLLRAIKQIFRCGMQETGSFPMLTY